MCFSHQCVMLSSSHMAGLEHPFQEDIQVRDEASKLELISPTPWSAAPLGNQPRCSTVVLFPASTSIQWIFLYLLHIRNILPVQRITCHDHIASKLSFQQARQPELFKLASYPRPWLTPLQLRYLPTHSQEENKSHHAICSVINFVLCQ